MENLNNRNERHNGYNFREQETGNLEFDDTHGDNAEVNISPRFSEADRRANIQGSGAFRFNRRETEDEETEEDYEGNGEDEDIIPDPEDFDEDYEDIDYTEEVDDDDTP